MRNLLPLLLAACIPVFCQAQTNSPDTSARITAAYSSIPDKSLHQVNDKYASLSNDVDKQTLKMLSRMQSREDKLKQKVQAIDSSKAVQLFAGSQAKYQQLQTALQSPASLVVPGQLKQYLGNMDSLATSLKFLSSANTTNLPIPADKLAQIQAISTQLQSLQARLQQAGDVQTFISQREQELKSQLSQYSNLSGNLLGINKEAYYYQQQLQQYRDLANDKQKIEQLIITKVTQLPAFQSFWQKFSILGQMFPMPSNYGTPLALAGLQSRVQLQSMLPAGLTSVNASTGGGASIAQQQFQQAQTQMNTLKDKLSQLGGGSGSGDMTMPDFQPDKTHGLKFLKRVSFGFNIETQPATSLLPITEALAGTITYKISDKATANAGIAYNLGVGRGFNAISFTSQGIGFRSSLDIKAKGSIWVTGAWEYNYMQQFSSLRSLHNNINVWQQSALAGLTKKYKISKNKEGNIQLLYDFLYRVEVPQGRPLVFRVGYNF